MIKCQAQIKSGRKCSSKTKTDSKYCSRHQKQELIKTKKRESQKRRSSRIEKAVDGVDGVIDVQPSPLPTEEDRLIIKRYIYTREDLVKIAKSGGLVVRPSWNKKTIEEMIYQRLKKDGKQKSKNITYDLFTEYAGTYISNYDPIFVRSKIVYGKYFCSICKAKDIKPISYHTFIGYIKNEENKKIETKRIHHGMLIKILDRDRFADEIEQPNPIYDEEAEEDERLIKECKSLVLCEIGLSPTEIKKYMVYEENWIDK